MYVLPIQGSAKRIIAAAFGRTEIRGCYFSAVKNEFYPGKGDERQCAGQGT
jgi:hypothetical protein